MEVSTEKHSLLLNLIVVNEARLITPAQISDQTQHKKTQQVTCWVFGPSGHGDSTLKAAPVLDA